MKTERLVILLAPEEKARITEAAQARGISVGALVRDALATLDAEDDGARPGSGRRLREAQAGGWDAAAAPGLSADQAIALEHLADVALGSMTRANAALDRAFAELDATKAYFAAKRQAADTP
jgi:hypothetical protein